MDYEAHYNRLILRARDRTLTGYVERHHVLPRCMGGGDEPGNIVALTADEHYVAHQLLVKINLGHVGLARTLGLMSKKCRTNKLYGWIRRRITAVMRGNKYSLGVRPSLETRAKLSAAKLGKKHSAEHVEKRAATLRGKKRPPLSLEWRANMSAALMGNKRCLGNVLSAEHRAKLSAATKGRPKGPFSEEHRARISMYRKGRVDGPRSDEARARIAAANRARTGRITSDETRARMSAAQKGRAPIFGRRLSEETKRKISAAHIGRAAWNKGIPLSYETKMKLSAAAIARHAKARHFSERI